MRSGKSNCARTTHGVRKSSFQWDRLEPRLLLHYGAFGDPVSIDQAIGGYYPDYGDYGEPPFHPSLAEKLEEELPDWIGGDWGEVVDWPFRATHAALMPTGKVIMFTKRGQSFEWDYTEPDDQTLGKFARLPYKQFCAGHVLLPDGRFMVVGGHISGFVGRKESAIYDPERDQWSMLPSMNAGRWYPSATVLANGDVAVLSGSVRLIGTGNAGGYDENYVYGSDQFQVNTIPQIWEASRNRWRTLAGADLSLPLYPRSFVAPNGKLFIAGPGAVTRYLDTDGTGRWTTVGETRYGIRDRGAAVMYDDGKVLILGGARLESNTATATAEVVDLNDEVPAWRYTNPMHVPRKNPNATVLPDGTVLVIGGVWDTGANDKGSPVYAVELWNPQTEEWTILNSSDEPRWYHSTTTLLPDGRILAAGGNATESAQVFSPPYLFRGPRPTITHAPDTIQYGTTFDIETPDSSGLTSVTLVRLGSATHSVNFDQRFSRLAFATGENSITVSAPPNGNLAPPGYYMLHVLQNGVPSEAKIVQLRDVVGQIDAAISPQEKPKKKRADTPATAAMVDELPAAGAAKKPEKKASGADGKRSGQWLQQHEAIELVIPPYSDIRLFHSDDDRETASAVDALFHDAFTGDINEILRETPSALIIANHSWE